MEDVEDNATTKLPDFPRYLAVIPRRLPTRCAVRHHFTLAWEIVSKDNARVPNVGTGIVTTIVAGAPGQSLRRQR